MGTVDERLRQGMAGGSRGTTLHEHAGQVPDVHQPNPQKQYHNTLRYQQRTEKKKSGQDCKIFKEDHRTKLPQDQNR